MAEKPSSDKSPSPVSTPHLAFTTISNVKLHVPILLSFTEPNYQKWSRLFLLLVRRFSLGDFLTRKSVPSNNDDTDWYQLDALIQGWILSTINDEVSDLVLSSTDSASELWRSIHSLFHDNKPARAMQLEHQFRTTKKGSLSISAYCQTLKNLADWLDDVDAPVSEQQLVLQVLRGLPDDMRGQTSFLQFQTPPPTFLQTRSALLLLERQQSDLDSADPSPGTALFSAGHTGAHPHSPMGGGRGSFSSSGGRGHSGSGGSRGRGGQRNRGRGRSSGSNPRTTHGQQPWQSPNPSPYPGLLGPKPTYPPLPQPATPPPPTPTALAHNFDTLSLRDPTWYMDTGASHHIASDQGYADRVRDSSVQ
ncbi:unnamed protein product [Cuscuta campestris]|uniref:Retrotransposon Copia-like N-terminal domain-containing protein n=1 Tax=Cuscuta campestris TaxID=132261 RepID=A0A484MR46_9ASTE|nr:unnamed protein product [Cuscuta campestris]